MVLHHPWLVESTCVELQIKRANCKLICRSLAPGRIVSLISALFKGQLYMATVTLILLAIIQAFLNPLNPDFVMHVLAIVFLLKSKFVILSRSY